MYLDLMNESESENLEKIYYKNLLQLLFSHKL